MARHAIAGVRRRVTTQDVARFGNTWRQIFGVDIEGWAVTRDLCAIGSATLLLAAAYLMAHFLEDLPFDISNPGAQALWELLWTNLSRQKDVLQIVSAAGLRGGLVNWEQPMAHVWYDVLHLARGQDKLLVLLDRVRRHPSAGAAVSGRLDELLQPAPLVEAAPSRGDVRLAWRGGEEAITGDRDTMLDVAFLELGAQRARSVVRILVVHNGSTTCGTGFLVGPRLVLTNHHVLFGSGREAWPDNAVAWFDYERSPSGRERAVKAISMLCDTIVGDVASDWAAIQLAEGAPAGADHLSLQPTLPVSVDDRVYVVQHPAGGPKKIGLHHNEVRYVDQDVVQYLTDTLPGSSGAPVFNERWEVVAIHHASVDAATPGTRPEVRNQGIRIERIAEALAKRAAT